MKLFALILTFALLAPTVADAKCFLFFCPPSHHAARHTATRSACNKIAVARAATDKSDDDFVKSFPPAQQKRVLLCLEGNDK
jgi:hypothetical protein